MAPDAVHGWRRAGAGVVSAAARARAVVAAAGARIDAVPAAAVDLALAGSALVAMVAERVAARSELGVPLPVALVLSAVIAACLAARRRAPLAAYLVGTAALAAEALWVAPSPVTPYVNLVGVYSVGQYATRGRALLGAVAVLPGVLGYFARADVPATVPAGVVFTWLLAWAVGYSAARRRDRQSAARRRMRREAVTDERTRIARELHDVVGHTLTVMVVRTGAARIALDSSPDQAREILLGIERTGRDALDELDHVLGVLRRDDGGDLQPGLAELEHLAGRMTEAGMAVAVQIEPPARHLPRSLDLSAYRIVQEALTNALRHGRARTASVTVACDGTRVRLDVRDDGHGPQPGYRPGRGLLGIAERAAVFAGAVEHGPADGGGFRVHAELPVSGLAPARTRELP